MERGDDKQYIPVKIKNGALSGAVATAEQFGMLAGHVFKLLGQLERELRDGDISAAPYVSGGRPVCEWCEYRAACQFDETRSDRQRKLSRISDSGVWKLIREGEEDG